MLVTVNTGTDARIEGADVISQDTLGVRYSGFRSLDRFLEQIEGLNVGSISWPGGALAEADAGRYGFEYPGLFNPALDRPDLSEMMAVAIDHNATLSIVLPTARYANRIEDMRADVREFMEDLLGGDYGPLPQNMIFHIGSEHYAHFQGLTPDGAAAGYGRVAAAMVDEISSALEDPTVNLVGADIDVSVQAGRTLQEDDVIRDSFTDENLANVDLVMHHRYASRAEGIDVNLNDFRPILEAWRADVTEAGGEAPDVHLSEWNVASLTRDEALTRFIRDMAAQGETVNRADIDLAGRTDVEFERYWQNVLSTRDYGPDAPRLYLELFSEYTAEGLGAASIHAVDLMHAGRMTYTDVNGNPVQFVGASMIDMLYESVEGTEILEMSEENSRSSDLWTYGFENDDRLVLFLASDTDTVVGDVSLEIEGLDSGYAAIWSEGLTAEVPADWMTRFGIPDRAGVDETNEGRTYAVGVRAPVEATVDGDTLSVTLTEAGQVVRILVARTPEEAAAIAEWAGEPDLVLDPESDQEATIDNLSLDDLLGDFLGGGSVTSTPGGEWLGDTINNPVTQPAPTPTGVSSGPGRTIWRNDPPAPTTQNAAVVTTEAASPVVTTPVTVPNTDPGTDDDAQVDPTSGGNTTVTPASAPMTPTFLSLDWFMNGSNWAGGARLDEVPGSSPTDPAEDDDAQTEDDTESEGAGSSFRSDMALVVNAATGAFITGMLAAVSNGLL